MNKERIPRIIHYCWFGNKPLTKDAKKCIESWKKHCPDYKIIEWNESNYDINKNIYTTKAYQTKKWAFLTDYVRLDVIYRYGGIYLDTDVELLKPLDDLLTNSAYMGQEEPGKVNTGLGFGAMPKHTIIKQNKDFYENVDNFLDRKGKLKKIICVKVTTAILQKHGFKNSNKIQNLRSIVIYPIDYFCPKKMGTNKITVTDNTYSIHHYDASWKSNNRIINRLQYRLIPAKKIIKSLLFYEK